MKNRVSWGKLTFWGLILVSLASLLLSACSSSTSSSTPTAKASTAPTSAANATSSTTPQSGGTIKIGMNRDAVFLGDPVDLTQQQDCIICRPAIEALARYDTTGTLVPWLASGWNIDSTALTMTITLKKGIKFQDGADLMLRP